MEKRLKILQNQLFEINNIIHGTVYDIEKLEQELAILEHGLDKIKENKKTLKNQSLIVSITGYALIKKELNTIESRFNKVGVLLEKYQNYLDSLIEKENSVLNELNEIIEHLDSQRKVLKFDLGRKKNGQK